LRERAVAEGRLIYLIGPSGAGKDTLLAQVRAHADRPRGWLVAHRYITRPAQPGAESHVAVSEREFFERQGLGLFALAWVSHGLHYAVGNEVTLWLRAGAVVLVNGSRYNLQDAAEQFGQRLRPVLLDLPASLQRERLEGRGREQASQVANRLAREQQLTRPAHPAMTVLDATAAPEVLVERLMASMAPEVPT